MALGLDSMQKHTCPPGSVGICPEMLPVNGSILLQHLFKVNFSYLNEDVWFDEQGDPPGKYEILNFRRRQPALSSIEEDTGDDASDEDSEDQFGDKDDVDRPQEAWANDSFASLRVNRFHRHEPQGRQLVKLAPGKLVGPFGKLARRKRRSQRSRANPKDQPGGGGSPTNDYEYVHIGSWSSSQKLTMFGKIQWLGAFDPPFSVCSLPCAQGHAKVSFLIYYVLQF